MSTDQKPQTNKPSQGKPSRGKPSRGKPSTGDMFRCEKCQMEIHVTKGCECEEGCATFNCCDQPMKNVTSLSVQNP